MFLEGSKHRGWIEVVCGSMFSGKTEELIRRMRRAEFANQRVEIFKPVIDVRYSVEEVVSHQGHSIRSTPVESPQNILLLAHDVDVVGIDEAQFFDESLVDGKIGFPHIIGIVGTDGTHTGERKMDGPDFNTCGLFPFGNFFPVGRIVDISVNFH